MKFERNGWTIRLNEDEDIAADGRQANQVSCFETIFISAVRQGKGCEMFTIKYKKADLMLLQVCMFDDGSIATYSYAPAVIDAQTTKKTIHIDILCNFTELNGQTIAVSFEGTEQYNLTAFWPQ